MVVIVIIQVVVQMVIQQVVVEVPERQAAMDQVISLVMVVMELHHQSQVHR